MIIGREEYGNFDLPKALLTYPFLQTAAARTAHEIMPSIVHLFVRTLIVSNFEGKCLQSEIRTRWTQPKDLPRSLVSMPVTIRRRHAMCSNCVTAVTYAINHDYIHVDLYLSYRYLYRLDISRHRGHRLTSQAFAKEYASPDTTALRATAISNVSKGHTFP